MDIPGKLKRSPYFGFIIGFIFGFALTKSLIAAAVIGLGGIAIQTFLTTKVRLRTDSNPKTGFLKREQDYLKSILVMAAIIIKADGKEGVHALAYVESKLRKDFSAAFVPTAMSHLRAELRKNTVLKKHTDLIAVEFDNASKVQLMHFLVGICTADSVMSNAERQALFDLSTRIEFSPRTLESIIAMFRFRTEQQQQHYQNRPVPDNKLENAYKILQITSTVSDSDLKKAYKKLALIHHPDKVAHQGEQVQKTSAEKFKTIAAAYDLICKKRGIV